LIAVALKTDVSQLVQIAFGGTCLTAVQPKTVEHPLITISPERHSVQTVGEVQSMHPDIKFPQKAQLETVGDEYVRRLYFPQTVQ
jgi:hypothetical protein